MENRRKLWDDIVVGVIIAIVTALIGSMATVRVLETQLESMQASETHQEHQIERIHREIYEIITKGTYRRSREND